MPAVIPINPKSTPGAMIQGDQRFLGNMAAQIARIDSRVGSLEATRTTIGPNSVDGTAIAPNSIDGTHISPSSITTSHIGVGSLDASVINTASLIAAVGTFTTINADQIIAGDIEADRMKAHVLEAVKAVVSNLQAITADMGALTAGSITGATVQTASTGARVVMDAAGLRGYKLDGITKTFEINTGTGIASFTGVAQLDPASVIPVVGLSGNLGGYNLLPNASFEDARGVMFAWMTNVGIDPSDPTNVNKASISSGGGTARLETMTAWDQYTHGSRGVKYTPSAPGTGANYFGAPTIKGKSNTKYVISIWVKGTSANPRSLTFMIGSTKADLSSNANLFPALGKATNGGWTRLSATFTTPADTRDLFPYFHFNDDGDTGAIYFDAVQLEEGEKATTFAPRADENIYASINSLMIGAGEIKANNIAAGAVQAGSLSIKFTSANMLANARFAYFTGSLSDPGVTQVDSPGYWQHYDNGGAGTATWSKVPLGGPTGKDSWRLVTNNATTAAKGFMTNQVYPFLSGVSYILSFFWKGNQPPTWAANGSAVGTWIDNPAPSTTTWQRYSIKIVPNADGPRDAAGGTSGTGYDWVYVRPNSIGAATDVQIANIQREVGDYPTPFAPASDELLPYSVGNTVLGPDSVTTEKILAGTITAADLYLVGTVGLSALNANIGNVTAGTITGAIYQSAVAGNYRAYIDSSGFYYKDPSGNNLVTMSGSNVSLKGQITASGLAFVNTGGGIAGGNTIYWYSGNYSSEIGHDTMYYTGSTTVNERIVQIPSGGGIAEFRVTSKNASSGEYMGMTLQHSSTALDQFAVYHSAAGTMFQLVESSAVNFPGHVDINLLYGGESIWVKRSTYMRLREDNGVLWDGGNYTSNIYGGAGTSHIVLPNSGQSTAGTAYTLGWHYAVGNLAYSDETNKIDIRDVPEEAALSRVRALRPRKWVPKGGSRTGFQHQGFVAQEVAAVIPDAVERLIHPETKDETMALDSMAIISHLVAAVQELSEIVNVMRGEKPDAQLSRGTVKALKIK